MSWGDMFGVSDLRWCNVMLIMHYRRRRFASFPALLVIEQANGFVSTVDWASIKGLDLDRLRGQGLQEGETPLPEPRPVTPQRSRPKTDFLSPPKSGKRQGEVCG
jgi:hypothetical protein